MATCPCINPANAPLPATFFGLTANTLGGGHDPTVSYGILRLWDTSAAGWGLMNTANGTISFTALDAWLTHAKTAGAEVMWCAGRTPPWAITGGSASCTGTFSGSTPKTCAQPPSDIDTTDQFWKTFVTALVNHSNGVNTATMNKIKYYECVNEADLLGMWTGSGDQLVKFCTDMQTIVHNLDPQAIVLGPSASTLNKFGVHLYGGSTCTAAGVNTAGYLACAGGPASFDAANIHAYILGCAGANCSTPEGTGGGSAGLLEGIAQLNTLMSANNISNKPVYFSEGSWGGTPSNSTLTDDQKVAYMGREYVYMWSNNILSYVWYAWDNSGFGTMAGHTPVINAWNNLRKWLIGSKRSPNNCATTGTQTTCTLIPPPAFYPNSATAQIMFDTTNTPTVTVPGQFTKFDALDGTSTTIVSHQVTLGPKPILVYTA